jgi:Ca2+-binding EF-hand superfamily protein
MWLKILVDARQGKPEEMWAEMFNALDEDHNGFVDIDELKDDMATVLKGETRTPEEIMAFGHTRDVCHISLHCTVSKY